MVQARAELTAGDLRLLYLAWLLALQSGEMDDEDVEPPVPAGLADLSAALQAIVDFFDIDEDLIAVAATASPSIQEPDGLVEWIASIPAAEKDALLARVAAGESAQVQALVLRGFRAATGPSSTRPARDPADLLEEKANRIDARAAALEEPQSGGGGPQGSNPVIRSTRTEAAWEKVDEWIATRRPNDYDLAVSLLGDLQALAERQDDSAAFRERFGELRAPAPAQAQPAGPVRPGRLAKLTGPSWAVTPRRVTASAGAGSRRWGATRHLVGQPDQWLRLLHRHAHQGRDARRETQVRLNLVATWREATVFTEAERAALELTEQGTRLADAAGRAGGDDQPGQWG